MIWIVVNIFLIVSEIFMYYLVATSFFTRKLKPKIEYISFLLLILCSILIIDYLGDNLLVKLLVLSLIYTIWAKTTRANSWIPSLFVSMFFNAFIVIADTSFVLVASFFSENGQATFMETPQSFYLFSYLAKCIEIIVIIAARSLLRKHRSDKPNSWQDWLRTAILPFSTLLLCIVFIKIFYIIPSLSSELLLCTFILFLTNFMSAFIVEKLDERQEIVHHNSILLQDLKKEQNNLNTWLNAYKVQRKQTHDFQNHLIVLRGLISNSISNDNAFDYIESLLHSQHNPMTIVSTHRNVADVIISQKTAFAQANNTQFVFQLDDLSHFPLSDDELTIVLANLLDNAIEACTRIPDQSQRHIKLKIETTPDVSFLYVENSTAEEVSIIDNSIIANTSLPSLHGFGIQNIRAILDRHGAVYFFDYSVERKVFIFSAQIST